MQDKAAGMMFVFVAVVAVVVISQMPGNADAFFEPFASKLIAKKLFLKQAFVPVVPPAVPKPIIYVGHFVQQPTSPPPPPPSPTYPPYGPQPSAPSYLSYGPPSPPSYQVAYGPLSPPSYQVAYRPPSQPSYAVTYRPPSPPSYSGYESTPVVKPQLPPGCIPSISSTSPPPVDYSHYSVQSSINYGNNGNNGNSGYRK